MRKPMFILVVSFLVATGPSLAVATDAIKGAFGMTLGEVLSKKDSRATATERFSGDAGLRYTFTPDHPFGALDEYRILVTPQTLVIYRIAAEGKFPSAARCEEELLALQEALERKYDAFDDNVTDAMVNSLTGVKVIRFGHTPRRIVGTCVGIMGEHTLSLSYIADDLERRAKAEKARMGEGHYQGLGL